MPLSTLQALPRDITCKTRGQDGFAVSFPVGLFHPLQHAGLSRRSPSGPTSGAHNQLRGQWELPVSEKQLPRHSHAFQGKICFMSSDWSPSGFLLTGRSAIVTGCARGLGRCLAHVLAAAGALVLACDLVGDGANAVAKDIQAAGGKAQAFPMDVTNGQAALDAVAFA